MTLLRIVPFGLLSIVLTLSACTSNTTQTDMPDDDTPSKQIITTIQLDNMGSTAYVILGIDGEGATANLNEENAEIVLRIGDRFRFENVAGASNHPLDFRNGDRDKLFGQSNSDGMLDDNTEADVQSDDNFISFTLTSGLASELVGYVCSFHPDMNGEISTID